MNGDPTKFPEWYKRFLRGVAQVESAGGQLMMNPTSTATGLYGQRYSEVDDLPMLQGVTREQFAADTALQNRIMEQRFQGNIPGVPGLMKNVIDLTREYQPQLGEKFTFRPDEVAALTNFLGRQRTREYFASIRDDKPFEVPGVNKTPEEYLKEYNLGFEEEYRFGGKIKKKKQYQQGGLLAQKDPTKKQPLVQPAPADVLARLSLGITPPDQQFRLRGEAAPFRTVKEQKDIIAEQESEGDIMEVLRYLPVTGEVIDAAELAKVAATGEDIYGQEQDPGMFAAMTAAGYLIPNVLEKPLKSAWRAVKQFPAKMPKKEFRELMGPEKDQARANLLKGHLEVYPERGYMTQLSGATPLNVRQLPSLMSGSKLENAVGKDGLIQVSQIENLINSKDISAAERQALQEVMTTEAFQTLREMGGGSKVDYNKFRDLTSGQVSVHHDTYMNRTNEYANYGVDRLGMETLEGSPLTNLIRTTDPDLQSTEYGHFGTDIIGHYRTFERPNEKGVLYISELQSDPLQARGPAGQKQVSLNIGKRIDDDVAESHIQGFSKQSEQARLALAEIERGGDPSPFLDKMDVEVLYRTIDNVPYYSGTMRGDALGIQKTALGGRRLTPDSDDVSHTILNYKNEINPEAGITKEDIDEILKPILENIIEDNDNYIKALKGGYRGGPNAKQANLIKNQDQFLISHILEQEAKGVDKLRFPTGETTSKIQGYGDIEARVASTRRDLEAEQGALDAMMVDIDTATGKEVRSPLANRVDAMGLSGMDADKAIDYLGRIRSIRSSRLRAPDAISLKDHRMVEPLEKFDNDALKQAYKELKAMTPEDRQLEINFHGGTIEKAAEQRAIDIKLDIYSWNEQLERIKTQREHLSRVNASTQATQGIMKGYDRLPKALKKHGLDATKVTDDVGNTWWEVDIPARLGEGVGEIRAYNKGGQVSDKIRVLKKEGYPQKQAVAIALAMKQEGRL